MKLKKFFPLLLVGLMGLSVSGCFDDDDPLLEQYKDWKAQNDQYLLDAENQKDENGAPYFTKIVPSFAPDTYVLVHWHNDRSATEKNLSPMDNSTTRIIYQLFNVEGEELSNSFSNPDSIYTSKPLNNIIGVWSALTSMHVGDSVTLVIPSQAGYGERVYGDIKPYSTLVYGVKLKAVTAYEVP